MAARHAMMAAILASATCSAVGCRAVGFNNPSKNGFTGNVPASMTVEEAVAAINQNAQAVNGLKAKTSITASVGGRKLAPFRIAATGDMQFERERNFRLQLEVMHKPIADLGSNSEGFWFWFDNRSDPALYTCKYEPGGRIPAGVPLTLQPDWIIEAMGLREITESEAQSMTIRRGQQPGTDELFGTWQTAGGENYLRKLVLNSSTKRIIEYQLIAPDRKTVITKAQPSYDPTKRTEGASSIPSRIKLTWVREEMELDVTLSRVDPNPSFEKHRAIAFAEPEMAGFERRDLAAMSASSAGRSGQTTIRESRPIPPAGSARSADGSATRVRLGAPAPIGLDGAALNWGDPMPLDSDLPQSPGGPAALIRNSQPTAPSDPATAAVAADAQRRAAGMLER